MDVCAQPLGHRYGLQENLLLGLQGVCKFMQEREECNTLISLQQQECNTLISVQQQECNTLISVQQTHACWGPRFNSISWKVDKEYVRDRRNEKCRFKKAGSSWVPWCRTAGFAAACTALRREPPQLCPGRPPGPPLLSSWCTWAPAATSQSRSPARASGSKPRP